MLVDALANPRPPGATESTVLGPFYVPGAPLRELRREHARAGGRRPTWCTAACSTSTARRSPAPSSTSGRTATTSLYAVQQPEAPEDHLRGRFRTRDDGSYAFLAVRPVPYPIPDDGPVGAMLAATGRHPWRPAHIHIIVRAPGYETRHDAHLRRGQRLPRLRRRLRRQAVAAARASYSRAADDPARPDGVEGEWASLELDLVLPTP